MVSTLSVANDCIHSHCQHGTDCFELTLALIIRVLIIRTSCISQQEASIVLKYHGT